MRERDERSHFLSIGFNLPWLITGWTKLFFYQLRHPTHPKIKFERNHKIHAIFKSKYCNHSLQWYFGRVCSNWKLIELDCISNHGITVLSRHVTWGDLINWPISINCSLTRRVRFNPYLTEIQLVIRSIHSWRSYKVIILNYRWNFHETCSFTQVPRNIWYVAIALIKMSDHVTDKT